MKKLIAIVSLLLATISTPLYGGSVTGTRHDLSTAGTPQVCEFCHTPHAANTNISGTPLWNRAETTQTFTLYGSATMNTAVGQPRTASRLCLSCHDGVNASTSVHGNTVSTKHDLVKPPGHPAPDMTSEPNCERCHSNMWGHKKRTLVLGTDLSNDHPISMTYPTPAQDPGFNTPSDNLKGWGGTSPNAVKLYGGYVECGSCHNVHDNDNAPFLRTTNFNSALCLTCHKK
ncbi:MAG: cytochrome c3 family protein [Betaproteobacteria bacterium]|nr:cytochrome c3 family protein [Betaproteobacteria bacterium]